ncbi:MAG: Gx transporter family protein [Culicoidibacterales bacterium]
MSLTQSSDNKFIELAKISEFALLLAMACVIQFFETLVPLPIPIPGVKIGLANSMTILILYRYGRKRTWQFSFARVVIVSLITGSFLSVPFWLSLCGAIVSVGMMTTTYRFRALSIIGVSMLGAIGHSVGQIFGVQIFLQIPQVIIYLPVLIVISLITGSLIGWLSLQLLPLLNTKKVGN